MTRAKARGQVQTQPRTNSEEQLILVDERNRAIGTEGKTAVHRAGLLHRAFSIFLVDDHGRLVLQRRSPEKYHSGGLWANACCGHPRPGEQTITGARRRLNEELGVAPQLSFGFFARYRAELDGGMHENEFVYVYFGRLAGEPRPDPSEVAEVALLAYDEVRRRIEQDPHGFAFWFRHYFQKHGSEIARLAKAATRIP
jgi:isopentenyl-diphosphate delta-isomerase